MLRKFILAAALFALSATAASAASRVWISEFTVLTATAKRGVIRPDGRIAGEGPAIDSRPQRRHCRRRPLSEEIPNIFSIVCEVQCAVRGDGSAATTSSILLPAFPVEYFGVQVGATISVIAAP
jgi:hypothetical protein